MTKLKNMIVSLLVGATLIAVPTPDAHAKGIAAGELSNVLRFRERDGWGIPSMRTSRDDLSITLRFRKAPADALGSLNAIVSEGKRTVFSHAEVTRRGKAPPEWARRAFIARGQARLVRSAAGAVVPRGPGGSGPRVAEGATAAATAASVGPRQAVPSLELQHST